MILAAEFCLKSPSELFVDPGVKGVPVVHFACDKGVDDSFAGASSEQFEDFP